MEKIFIKDLPDHIGYEIAEIVKEILNIIKEKCSHLDNVIISNIIYNITIYKAMEDFLLELEKFNGIDPKACLAIYIDNLCGFIKDGIITAVDEVIKQCMKREFQSD